MLEPAILNAGPKATGLDRESAIGSAQAFHARERRGRMLAAMVELAAERGFDGAPVTELCARAKCSRRAFYEEFPSRQACFLAVLDEGQRVAGELFAQAFARARAEHAGPGAAIAGLREALAALLAYLDAHPRLARVWMVESQAAGAWALEHRERRMAQLTAQIVDAWEPPQGPPGAGTAITAPAVVASLHGLIQRHLISGASGPLLAQLGPLMGVVTAPYLDVAAVKREVARAEALSRRMLAGAGARQAVWAVDERMQEPAALPPVLVHVRAHMMRACLRYLAANPGASNRQVALAIGIASHTQVSALLSRLQRLGLLQKRAGGAGRANAWRLSAAGVRAVRALDAHR